MKLSFEGCVLDLDTRLVFHEGRTAAISPKAFALLELLALRRPRAVSRAEIHDVLWPGTFVSETNLANLVVEVRAALGDDAHASRIVRTVPRFGYAFCASARVEGSESGGSPSGNAFERRVIWGRREIALAPGENLIGRDHAAVVWINDESVSRRHAHLVVDEAGAILEDLGSKNGTTLRGRPVTRPVRLEDGDEFMLGNVALRFRAFGGPATTRTGTKRGRGRESA